MAVATTLAGEFTVLPSPGLEMSRGKSEPGAGGGCTAGGAGRELVVGLHVCARGVGEGFGLGEGEGLGIGLGDGVGIGMTGVGVGVGMPATIVEAPPAHPAMSNMTAKKQAKRARVRTDKDEKETFTP